MELTNLVVRDVRRMGDGGEEEEMKWEPERAS